LVTAERLLVTGAAETEILYAARMRSNLPNVGLLLGVVMLALGTWSVRFSWQRIGSGRRHMLAVIGVACAVAVFMLGEYRPSPTERYVGFPFLAIAFIKRGNVWLDYLGPFTVPALVANAYVGFTVPFITASAWLLVRRRAA